MKKEEVVYSIEQFEKACTRLKEAAEEPLGDISRDAFKEAFKQGMLSNEQVFLSMLDDRNLSSHTYKESLAKDIYQRIKGGYIMTMEALIAELKKMAGLL